MGAASCAQGQLGSGLGVGFQAGNKDRLQFCQFQLIYTLSLLAWQVPVWLKQTKKKKKKAKIRG